MSEVKKAKAILKMAKKPLAKAEVNLFKAGKYGSERQITLCKKRLENAKKKFDKATDVLAVVREANPNTIKKTMDYFKETTVKKICTWTGLAVTAVVTTIAGVVLYDYLNDDEENQESADAL